MFWLVFAATKNVARELGWLPETWLKKIEGRVRPWPAGEWGSRCGICLVQVRYVSVQAADYKGLLWADISWDKVAIISGSQSEKGNFSFNQRLYWPWTESVLCAIEAGRASEGGSSVLWIAPKIHKYLNYIQGFIPEGFLPTTQAADQLFLLKQNILIMMFLVLLNSFSMIWS